MGGIQRQFRRLWQPVEQLFESAQIRYVFVGMLLLLLLAYLLVRIIVFITGPDGARWREVGKTLNKPEPVEIPPLRGTIYASDGRPVAITAPVYRLYLDFQAGRLELLHRPAKDSVELAKQRLMRQQLGRDLDTLSYRVEQSFKDRGITIERQKMRERWRRGFQKKLRYQALIDQDITYLQYKWLEERDPLRPVRPDSSQGRPGRASLLKPAIIREERSQRINPFGSLALRTIGSVYGQKEGNLSRAKQGIELGFDSVLRGQVGKGLKLYAAQRYNLITREPAVDGYSVYTTLDMDIQSQLERIMRQRLEYYHAASGTAILLDVPTGQVLAMTNLMRLKDGSYAEGQNFAVTDLSEPGSTFKVASMLVALDNGMVHPGDEIDVGNGIWHVGGRRVVDHNADRGGYGLLTASQVIENSSNVGMAKIIQQHFADKPSEYVRQVRELGFGYDLCLELPGSSRARIRMPDKKTWYGTTLAWMSFGYETQIPPIYTAAFFNAIANGGRLMKPYLVREVRDKDGAPIYQYAPQVVKEAIAKPESIKSIQEMLRRVVTEGTGKRSLKSDIVAISGKSGTAQIAKGGRYKGADGVSHQVSFCGYFPSERPRYTLMVVIREPSKEFAAGGGSMAGPVVRDLAEAIISMQTPSSLDSVGNLQVGRQRGTVSIGRKDALATLAQTTGVPYQPDAKIGGDAYIRIGPSGREYKQRIYPEGYVPNVTGMSAQDAAYLLMRRGYQLRYVGYGQVVGQQPLAGVKAGRGTAVTLYLSAHGQP